MNPDRTHHLLRRSARRIALAFEMRTDPNNPGYGWRDCWSIARHMKGVAR